MEQIIPEPAHGALAHRDHDAVVAEGRDDAHRQDGGQLEQAGSQAGKVGGAGIEHGDDVVIHSFWGKVAPVTVATAVIRMHTMTRAKGRA